MSSDQSNVPNCRAIAQEIYSALHHGSRLTQWQPVGNADEAYIRIKVPEAEGFDYRVTIQPVRAAGPPAPKRKRPRKREAVDPQRHGERHEGLPARGA